MTSTATRSPVSSELVISGMTCASCASHVTKALRKVPGVDDAVVNLATERATVLHDPDVLESALIGAVKDAGYEASPPEEDADAQRREAELRDKRRLLVLAVAFFVPTFLISMFAPNFPNKTWLLGALTLPVWAIVGWSFHRSALAALRSGATSMDTLISLGSTAAFGLSIYDAIVGKEAYFETASAIVTLVFIGKYLEVAARARSNRALRTLLELRPANAHRRNADGSFSEVPVDLVRVDDVMRVSAGERIPVDATIIEGSSSIDRSLLTGESMPIEVTAGEHVEQGAINGDGTLMIRATAVGAGTALARIVEIVRQAQGSTPPVQRLADRVAAVFVPSILLIALLTSAGWLLTHHIWSDALISAVAVLVVACPCALGLATPTAIIAGVGVAARHGILFKNADALEATALLDEIVFDKTGTLTQGVPHLIEITPVAQYEARDLLRLAASVESGSTHPLAHAIVNAAHERAITLAAATEIQTTRGAGIAASVEGARVLVGTAAFLRDAKIDVSEQETSATRVYLARNDTLLGSLDVADPTRENAREAVDRLTQMRVAVALVSGDAAGPTARVAREAGIDNWHAAINPESKASIVMRMQAEGAHVGFVGDGINDAPALARANVGLAMGGGTAVALETSDAAIMSNDPQAVVYAIALARSTMRTIRQNLFWAFAYNVVLIPLAAVGIVHPIFAAAAMGASSLFVVGNSLLLSRR